VTQPVSEAEAAPDAVIRFAMTDVPFGAALWRVMIGKLLWTWILAIAVAAVAVLLYLAGVGRWILWLGFGAPALMLATTVAAWLVAARRWRQKAGLAGEQPSEVGAGATGLHSRNGLGETRVAWPVIKRVQRFPAYWLIHFLTTDDVVVIPTAAMTPQFRAAFDRHAGAGGVRVFGD
jgi:hypothetical protein